MPKSLSEVYRRSRKVLILIGITHVTFVIITLWLLYELNLNGNGEDLPSTKKMIMINASLLGFLGSLLYFSRKVYSYLITNKFYQLLQEQGKTSISEEIDLDRFKSVIIGYYIYLSTRPIAGFVIGPILLMLILAGLTTLSKPVTGCDISMSKTGIYLIYVLSFIGGYSSSDLFDYFANLGKKLISKLDAR